jgi:hypothetical protein
LLHYYQAKIGKDFKSMRRSLNYGLITLLSLLIIALWWPVKDLNCDAGALFTSETAAFHVQATKVVVRPWLGEHHVYGIFMVPNEFEQSPFFVLSIKGIGDQCSKPSGNLQYLDGVSAEPGTHLIRDFIRTRTAVRLIFQGLYFYLNNTQNWNLIFPLPLTNSP